MHDQAVDHTQDADEAEAELGAVRPDPAGHPVFQHHDLGISALVQGDEVDGLEVPRVAGAGHPGPEDLAALGHVGPAGRPQVLDPGVRGVEVGERRALALGDGAQQQFGGLARAADG